MPDSQHGQQGLVHRAYAERSEQGTPGSVEPAGIGPAPGRGGTDQGLELILQPGIAVDELGRYCLGADAPDKIRKTQEHAIAGGLGGEREKNTVGLSPGQQMVGCPEGRLRLAHAHGRLDDMDARPVDGCRGLRLQGVRGTPGKNFRESQPLRHHRQAQPDGLDGFLSPSPQGVLVQQHVWREEVLIGAEPVRQRHQPGHAPEHGIVLARYLRQGRSAEVLPQLVQAGLALLFQQAFRLLEDQGGRRIGFGDATVVRSHHGCPAGSSFFVGKAVIDKEFLQAVTGYAGMGPGVDSFPASLGRLLRQALALQPDRRLLQEIQGKLAHIVACRQKEQRLRRDVAAIAQARITAQQGFGHAGHSQQVLADRDAGHAIVRL